MFVQGCHGQGKVRGKRTFFMVREKSGNLFDIVKVSEKSGNSVFLFIVHKFSSFLQDFEMHFLSENTKSMPQSKQSDQHSTSNTCSSCGQWFSCQCLFFQIPSSSRKEVENEEKTIDGLQKKLK